MRYDLKFYGTGGIFAGKGSARAPSVNLPGQVGFWTIAIITAHKRIVGAPLAGRSYDRDSIYMVTTWILRP